MNKILKIKKFYAEDESRWIRVTAQIHHLEGNKYPYFSITAESGDIVNGIKKRANSFGCLHDDIASMIPELAKYIPFHLCNDNGIPLYYYENSLYHLKNGNYDGFKSCSLFGILENDHNWNVENLGEYGYMWLNSRLDNVKKAYFNAMAELFGE